MCSFSGRVASVLERLTWLGRVLRKSEGGIMQSHGPVRQVLLGGLPERSKGIGPCSNRVPAGVAGRLKGAQET